MVIRGKKNGSEKEAGVQQGQEFRLTYNIDAKNGVGYYDSRYIRHRVLQMSAARWFDPVVELP